jgi:hypothetical protein
MRVGAILFSSLGPQATPEEAAHVRSHRIGNYSGFPAQDLFFRQIIR